MLYTLLIIIAIGVLLLSNEGKTLLSWIISSGLLLGLLAIVGIILLFSYNYISDNQTTIINGTLHVLGVFFIWFVIYKIGNGFRHIKHKISKRDKKV